MFWYYFDGKIENDTVNALVDKLQNEDDIHLYFTTTGGYIDVMDYLIAFFNTKKITIYLTDRLISAGTHLFTRFKGKLIITDNLDFIVFHLADRQIYTLRKSESEVNEKTLLSQTKVNNELFAKELKEKNLLTDIQLKSFLKGNDVVVYKNQFKNWKLN